MTREQIQHLSLKAIEAEGRAAVVLDPAVKTEWLAIARAYYELAENLLKTVSRGTVSAEPLPPASFQGEAET